MEVYKGIIKIFVKIISIYEDKYPKNIPQYLLTESGDRAIFEYQSSAGCSFDDRSIFSVDTNSNVNDRKISFCSKDQDTITITNNTKIHGCSISVPQFDKNLLNEKSLQKNFECVLYEQSAKIISNFIELLVIMCKSRPDFLTSIFLGSYDNTLDKRGKTLASIFPQLLALPIPSIGVQFFEMIMTFINPNFETYKEMKGILGQIIAPTATIEIEKDYFIY